MPNYYPIMLDIRGRAALVIGGNRIAAEKAAALVASGANVTVMNPEFCDELLSLARQQQVTLRYKTYEPGDLAGAFVVVAAAENPQQIEAIWTETQERGQLVNIVDVPSRCSFIVPSILRRGQLTIAVSTEGASPGLAKRIRHYLETLFPPAYGRYLKLAAAVRGHLRKEGLSYEQRDDFFGDFFTSDVLHHLTEQHETEALAVTVDLLHHYDVNIAPETLAAELKEVG
jgi:precorrin-2 dehydrogenase/sirohydrochlorin ferrochelatase